VAKNSEMSYGLIILNCYKYPCLVKANFSYLKKSLFFTYKDQ